MSRRVLYKVLPLTAPLDTVHVLRRSPSYWASMGGHVVEEFKKPVSPTSRLDDGNQAVRGFGSSQATATA